MNYAQKRTWAEISINNIEHNCREMMKTLPEGCGFVGVVKADAYGHGAVPAAKRLQEIGVRYLAVAFIDEAAELRNAGITMPILILGTSPSFLARDLAELDITQAVGSIDNARELNDALEGSGMKLKVHLKVDTGMGRLGFYAGDPKTPELMAEVMNMPNLDVEGVFTHYAVSDEFGDGYTGIQYMRFKNVIAAAEKVSGKSFKLKHCANSGSVINYRKLGMDMVRPGIALYGCYPANEHGGIDLRPAMELKTRILAITKHYPGDSISYGRTYRVEDERTFAVLPIGYADGLHRVLSNKMEVLIHGQRAPQRGRICMDMCMVDITNIPDCKVGDVVTIFGTDGEEFISVDEQAEKAGTISYELLCAVSKRVPRVYVD